MATELRKTGISVIGEIPWGAHFCHFYETNQDLLDTVLPYLKAGLEQNEFCLWVTAESLTTEEARRVSHHAVPDFACYLAEQRIEIVPYDEWYLKGGAFDLHRVITGWREKLDQALARGYAGMRVAACTAWLQKKDWKDFHAYETELSKALTHQRMVVLCAYSLANSGAADILDVAQTHEVAVIRRNGEWEVVETPALKQAKTALKRLNEELEQRVVERTRELAAANAELRKEIAEHKRTEEQLRRAEEQARTVIDAIPQQIWSGPADGSLDYCNDRWRTYSGLRQEDLQGEGWQRMLHPDDKEQVLKAWRESVANGTPYEQEERHRAADGTYRWFLSRGVPLRDAEGRIERWYGTNTDIEDRKRIEEKLRQSEEQLTAAQRLAHLGSWTWDLQSHLVTWSDELYRIFGFEPQEIDVAHEAMEFIHPEDRDMIMSAVERSLKTNEPYSFDYRVLRPDGEERLVHSRGYVVSDEHGVPIRVFGSTLDITKRKQAEEALERAFHEIQDLKDQLYRENLALREEIDTAFMFEEIVGASPALQAVLAHVAKVAPTDSTVLITGETGTGKELIARAIHKRSPRAAHAFVSVNCAAIPPSLIASELFGHEKGAFTGALQRRMGRFELADGGTLFLDEIGELPVEAQTALLRVLEERQFERVGGTQPLRVDVRVIAATNRDLQTAIEAGAFRRDLFYRLNVFPIELPPLRERQDDIPLLVQYFLDRYARKMGKKIRDINLRTLELLRAYPWPGNIRELQNVIERSVILCETETLTVNARWLAGASVPPAPAGQPPAQRSPAQERQRIEAALAESRGRVAGPSGGPPSSGCRPRRWNRRSAH